MLKKRIDRAIINKSWRMKFPEAFTLHLPHVNFDHCPILLSTSSRHLPIASAKPFLFQAMWPMDHRFKKLVEFSWPSDEDGITAKTATFAQEFKIWNKETFGSVFKKKKVLIARLNGAQKSLATRPNKHLFKLNKELHDELNIILQQEEILRLKKSREKWINQGDRNTSFFHFSTIVRKRRNKIEGYLPVITLALFLKRVLKYHCWLFQKALGQWKCSGNSYQLAESFP